MLKISSVDSSIFKAILVIVLIWFSLGFSVHSASITCLDFNTDNSLLLSGSSDMQFFISNSNNGKVSRISVFSGGVSYTWVIQ